MRDAACQSLAVGFFDGVHLGHQAILAGAGRALTFRNHPLSVLAPARAPRLIMTLGDRLAAIRACGVRDVVALDFTPELAALSPDDFIARYLAPAAGGGRPCIRCGANWNFGKGGVGDAAFLRSRGFSVEVVPFAEFGGAPISSSRIRATLAAGDVVAANAMLGRPFRVAGERRKGKGVGTSLGFPTVNLELPSLEIDLPRGVYVVSVGGVAGLANYGVAPTMGERRWPSPILEIHFVSRTRTDGERSPRTRTDGEGSPRTPPMDWAVSNPWVVDFLRFVRPERKFDSVAALQAQIARDREVMLGHRDVWFSPPYRRGLGEDMV